MNIEKDRITMSCELDSASCKCTSCGQSIGQVHQRYERTVRDLNMASREVYLSVKIRQFYCKTCHVYFTESLDFADSNKSHTHRQEEFMFLVGRKQSYSETAV